MEMRVKILVVDDSPTVGSTVEWALTHHGYRVQVARDALEALAALPDFAPDLIILDIRMPHLDGIQLCEMIRGKAEYDGVPIIMLSGLSGDDSIERAIDAGCDDYITKPVNDEKLLSVVEVHLERTGTL
jgi:DNA-binding response OmpR family regulator